MIKIVFFVARYGIGGVSTLVRNLMNSLDKGRFEIVLMVEKIEDRHYPVCSNVKLINLDILPKRGIIAKLTNMASHILSIRRHINNEAPYAVLSFATQANCYTLLSLLFNAGKRPKVIINEQSEEMFLKFHGGNLRYMFFRGFYRLLMRILYNKSDYIVPASKSIAAHIIREVFLVSPYKIKVVYNSADINRIRELSRIDDLSGVAEKGTPCIGTISRLSPEKGVHFLIRGFKMFLNKADARLLIVGDGTERQALEKLAEDLGIKDKITFAGWQDNPFKYLRKMDVFVLPSLWEGFSNVILEAMACRVPVVASDSTGGIREAIEDGISGIIAKPRSPMSISESICELLTDTEKRNRIIEKAYERVNQFDLSLTRKQYESLIFN